ncbi:MAG TPA: SDR family oxidoreductase [Bacteroidales bacterium]|nr:SDR family oxidoreductase [Bacteroidales bacterium]
MNIQTYNRLKDQPAIITGAATGIGKAIAIQYALEGAKVVINYLKGDPADEVVDKIKEGGGDAIAIEADVSQEEDVKKLFAKTIEAYGTVHILVNNAGIQKDSGFIHMTLKDWQKVIDVNLTGQFLCAREAAKEFLRRGIDENVSNSAGKIIFMSSVHETIPWAGHANYASSKGGISQLMRTVAQELAPQKIRANSLAPGAVKTPINKKVWDNPDSRKTLLKLIPDNRIGEPLDIARAAVWLASDESDYITGHSLYVDGGMTLFPGFATGG